MYETSREKTVKLYWGTLKTLNKTQRQFIFIDETSKLFKLLILKLIYKFTSSPIKILSVFTEPDTWIIEFIGRMKKSRRAKANLKNNAITLPDIDVWLTRLSRNGDNVVLAQGPATNET